jgi:hypothetical protein
MMVCNVYNDDIAICVYIIIIMLIIVWLFDPSMGDYGEWSWRKGTNALITIPWNGTIGVPDDANYPAGTSDAAVFFDPYQDKFWFYGNNNTDTHTHSIFQSLIA